MKFPYSTHAITPFSHRVRLRRRRTYFDSIVRGGTDDLHLGLLKISISPVHSPLFSRKIIEIERFALRAAILHECQNYLGGGGGLGGSVKNRGTVITSLQLAFRRRDSNFTPFTIH